MVILRRIRSTSWLVCIVIVLVLGQLSSPLYATSRGGRFESSLGANARPEIIKQYGGEYVLPLESRLWVAEVFRRLVAVTERDDLDYTLTVLNSSELNAFALPGGYAFITRGLLNAIGTDEAKLAAVLGHEIAHIEEKHGVNAVLRQLGLTVLVEVGVMALDLATADLLPLASAALVQLVSLGWGREAEFEADMLGQALAIEAGFDGIGAVSLLEDLLPSSPDDLPMKIFRTHPDTALRQKRLVENLASFWSEPVWVREQQMLERLNLSRNSKQARRNDPNGRYLISLSPGGSGLQVYDQQTEQSTAWLEQIAVRDFAWSLQGHYLAVLVEDRSQGELWICDRWGQVVRKVSSPGKSITGMSWSPQGNQLALDVDGPRGKTIMVTYVDIDVLLPVGGELGGSDCIWLDSGLYFNSGSKWYHTSAPLVEPVTIRNPVPQVLQRQRILSPQVLKEGNTIRLTRPSLTLP